MSDLKVIAIDRSDQKPNAHVERLKREFYEAWEALKEALRAAGLPSDTDLTRAMFFSAVGWVGAFEQRALRLEAQLRAALACDELSDERRNGILRALYGKKGTNRMLMSEVEARLLEQYRQLDHDERHMLRTLVDRLVALHAVHQNGGVQ